jgi:LysM repeat protein
MKRVFLFLIFALCSGPALLRAQDAATEERLNKLAAQIEVLIEAKDQQNRKIEQLARAIENLQAQASKPDPGYASQEDLKLLADKLKEVDRKRQEDNERILDMIKTEIPKILRSGTPRSTPPATIPDEPSTPKEGYEHVVKSGETLSAIIQAYRDNGVKVTLNQVLRANPGLKPEQLRPGQKVFIPDPKQ